jgi:hypothetical protein
MLSNSITYAKNKKLNKYEKLSRLLPLFAKILALFDVQSHDVTKYIVFIGC